MAAQPKYNALYHDDWAWSMAAMGATNEEIAEAMGVSKRTILRWAKDHESFGKALAEGKAVSDAKVIRSLYKMATGYEPSVAAQCFWLKNRQRERWQDRPQDYIQSGGDGDTEVQIYLPDNGRGDE